MTIEIRPLAEDDYKAWLPLWLANNMGQCDEAVTAQTWARLCDPAASVKGLAAWDGDVLTGLVHYILHPVTGHLNPACYMQDVFVDPVFRKRGIAQMLVETLAKKGQQEKWARLYWLAERDNLPAQKLYAHIGVKLDFTFHILPLS